MEVTVSSASLASMVFEIAISIIVPLLLLLILKLKTGCPIAPLIAGSVVFILFALVFERACNALVLGTDTALAKTINNSNFLYVFYAVLAAGVFEEMGRYVAFKLPLKKYTDKENAIMYGIGHGGTESIILVGITAFINLVLSATLNSVGMDAFLNNYASDNMEAMRGVMTALATADPSEFIFGGIERLAAIAIQISLSVFVFMSVRDVKKRFLLPVAILVHMAANVAPVLYQRGVLTSLPTTEAIVISVAAIISAFAYRAYTKFDEEPAKKKK